VTADGYHIWQSECPFKKTGVNCLFSKWCRVIPECSVIRGYSSAEFWTFSRLPFAASNDSELLYTFAASAHRALKTRTIWATTGRFHPRLHLSWQCLGFSPRWRLDKYWTCNGRRSTGTQLHGRLLLTLTKDCTREGAHLLYMSRQPAVNIGSDFQR
jgi:hypothetical protein